jgi:hypothetical protein
MPGCPKNENRTPLPLCGHFNGNNVIRKRIKNRCKEEIAKLEIWKKTLANRSGRIKKGFSQKICGIVRIKARKTPAADNLRL